MIFGYFVFTYYIATVFVEKGIVNPKTGEAYNIEEIVSITQAILMGMGQLTAILPNITNLSKALVVGKKIFDVVERVSEIGENSDEDKTENKMISLKQGIEFKGVHFRYPTAPEGLQDTLQGVSFEIKAGTSTAIVGASGSGKSTIVQMIERFYDPRKGEIFLDGKNIKECSLS